jgi:Ribosomal protein L13
VDDERGSTKRTEDDSDWMAKPLPSQAQNRLNTHSQSLVMSFPGQTLQRAWHLVDAKNQTVGRVAGQIAQILKGKHKPTFQPNKDMGDHVIVINAEKVRMKGPGAGLRFSRFLIDLGAGNCRSTSLETSGSRNYIGGTRDIPVD